MNYYLRRNVLYLSNKFIMYKLILHFNIYVRKNLFGQIFIKIFNKNITVLFYNDYSVRFQNDIIIFFLF